MTHSIAEVHGKVSVLSKPFSFLQISLFMQNNFPRAMKLRAWQEVGSFGVAQRKTTKTFGLEY